MTTKVIILAVIKDSGSCKISGMYYNEGALILFLCVLFLFPRLFPLVESCDFLVRFETWGCERLSKADLMRSSHNMRRSWSAGIRIGREVRAILYKLRIMFFFLDRWHGLVSPGVRYAWLRRVSDRTLSALASIIDNVHGWVTHTSNVTQAQTN